MMHEAPQLLSGLRGALLGAQDGCIFGWAAGPDQQPLAIEIVGDDDVLLVVRTGLPVPSGWSDEALPQESAFVALLGEQTLRAYGRITARLANLGLPLAGAWYPHRPQVGHPGFHGAAYHRGGLRIHGWAMPQLGSRRSARVLALLDGQQVAEAGADRRDASLADYGAGVETHGFDLSLPLELADGRMHRIVVCTDDGRELAGSPLQVYLPPAGVHAWLRGLTLPAADHDLLLATAARWQRLVPLSLDWSAYPQWKARFGEPPEVPISASRVLVVVAEPTTQLDALAATLRSLLGQRHTEWQALVLRPRSTSPGMAGNGASGLPTDPRIRLVPQAAWPRVLDEALGRTGYVAVLQGGDTWHPRLLDTALHTLKGAGACASYCDAEDDSGGPPWFKPDWCPDTFAALPVLEHGFVCRAQPLQEALAAGGSASCAAGVASGWPRLLGAHLLDRGRANRQNIVHVPYPLHHCGSGRPASGNAPRHIEWPEPPEWPSVGLIVPTRDQVELLRACLESLRATDYPDLHVCVVDNQSTCPDTLAYLDGLSADGVRVLRYPHRFNFAAICNAAVGHMHHELVALVNNDIRALDPQWLRHMVRQLLRPGVAAVGAKLLWPNGMVQHVGVPLGLHGLAGHTGNQWLGGEAGYHHCNQITRSVSAVTAACLLSRRTDYLAVGGMDADAFPVNFNDVDLCLRLGEQVGRVVVTPDAVLEHAESASRGRDESPERQARQWREHMALYRRWAHVIGNDPYYNPNLGLDRYSHDGLALPPRHFGVQTGEYP